MAILISIDGPDQKGLISSVVATLFDRGFNLGDTSFAVLGTGFEFNTVADLPAGETLDDVRAALASIDMLRDCEIDVRDFAYGATRDETGMASHAIVLRGGDQPGLLARLTEVLLNFDANIVRLNADRIPGTSGNQYVTSLELSVSADRAPACLAALANTAGQLQLSCDWRTF